MPKFLNDGFMRKTIFFLLLFFIIAGLSSCRKTSGAIIEPEENLSAKKMLQGIWVDEDGQNVAFKASGDTIFYPDSTSQPVYFQVVGDTLVLHGVNVTKYAIIRQTSHLFVFRNQNGDDVKCVRSDDPDDASLFSRERPLVLSVNQGQLIKRDTVVMYGNERYHCYVQVNPTTYKVVSQSYNNDGVAVDNVYYDNIINLNVYRGAQKLFGADFRKQQFGNEVPEQYLRQGVLSDFLFDRCDERGIHYVASFIIPGASMSSYQVEVVITYGGSFAATPR